MKISLIFFLFFFGIGCTCTPPIINKNVTQTSNRQDTPKYRIYALQKYGPNNTFYFNTDSSYVLCLGHLKSGGPNDTRFFIYDQGGNTIRYEETNAVSSVKWTGTHQIRVERIPGMVKTGDPPPNRFIYFYNVKTKERTTETTYKP